MILKSKLKTIFEFKIFKLWHMSNLMFIRVQMQKLRRETKFEHPGCGGGTKRSSPDRLKFSKSKMLFC